MRLVDEVETATAIVKKHHDELKVKMSERTVRRALQEAGIKPAEKEKKPRLSAKNIKMRLEFARRHKDWTIEDWKRVIWWTRRDQSVLLRWALLVLDSRPGESTTTPSQVDGQTWWRIRDDLGLYECA